MFSQLIPAVLRIRYYHPQIKDQETKLSEMVLLINLSKDAQLTIQDRVQFKGFLSANAVPHLSMRTRRKS
jgi:hypothetical protein